MPDIQQPFTNVQLELLRTFAHNLNEEELLQLRKLLAEFFAQRAIDAANHAWDERGWTNEDVDRLLNTKLRKRS
ncbi:MAG: hypothetical protein KDE46_19360 [Caldilineaceae bacterium]|nr:hypothetical protein [Caldilineaceae bacterium]